MSASGAGSARETHVRSDDFSFPGEPLPSPPRRDWSSSPRRESRRVAAEIEAPLGDGDRFSGGEIFSRGDADGARGGGPREAVDFAASRSALDEEMENATALLDALREGRVAPSLDGSDVSLTGSRSRSGSPARRRHRRDSRALYASEDEGSFRSYQYQYE